MRETKAGNRASLAAGWRKICAGFLLVSMGLLAGCGSMATKPATTNSAGKYPEKPITVIVPFSAGGVFDMIARAMEKKAPQYLGQPLVVVNKPGGTGSIGWNELAASNPDGYTIGIVGMEILINPLYGPTKYNYSTALAPIGQVSAYAQVLAVQADQPWDNLNALIEYCKENPGQVKFGHSGIGSLSHIIGETFAKTAGVSIEQVPFRGASESTAALLGGHIQLLVVNPTQIKEFVKSGKVKLLAVSSENRVSEEILSQVPTFKEQGFNVVIGGWHGVAIPKEVPPEIKMKLAEGLKAIINDPDFKRNMEDIGLPLAYLNPLDTEAVWLADQQKYTKIIQETGILDKIREQKK